MKAVALGGVACSGADDLVGFAMLYDDPEAPEYFLWRLTIADAHQGRGYGRRAAELLVDHVRTRPGARELLTSYVPEEGGPEGFYKRLGFVETGEVDGGEVVCRRALGQ